MLMMSQMISQRGPRCAEGGRIAGDGMDPPPPEFCSVPRPSEGHQSGVEEEEDGRGRRRRRGGSLSSIMSFDAGPPASP